MRSASDRTFVASMSSAKPSKRWPVALRNRIAPSALRASVLRFRNDGRYHATTRIPAACAASMKRPASSGRKTCALWL